MDGNVIAACYRIESVPMLPEAGRWLERADLPDRVAVGWSGGLDSTALLLALRARGHDVRAWHVDHGWRPESAMESEMLRQRASAWGIPFSSARVETPPASNREAVSRRARYRCFAAWGVKQGIDALCLAHHRDDQAETVCMRMLQGAGAAGCSGMRGERVMRDGLRLLRPLLHLPKSELESVLLRAGVTWLDDVSNRDVRFLRNRIRHRLFPAMRQAGVEPVDLWGRWQQQAERLARQLDRAAEAVPIERHSGSVSIDWGRWLCQPAPVRAFMLQRMMKVLFGADASLGRRHIVLVERWIQEGGRGGVDLSRSRLSHRDGRLRLAATEARLCRSPQ